MSKPRFQARAMEQWSHGILEWRDAAATRVCWVPQRPNWNNGMME